MTLASEDSRNLFALPVVVSFDSHVVDIGTKQSHVVDARQNKRHFVEVGKNKSLVVDAGRKLKAMVSKKYLLANIMTVILIFISKEKELIGGLQGPFTLFLILRNFISGAQNIRGGTRLPSECDYLQKNSSLWRLSMNNRHKASARPLTLQPNATPTVHLLSL